MFFGFPDGLFRRGSDLHLEAFRDFLPCVVEVLNAKPVAEVILEKRAHVRLSFWPVGQRLLDCLGVSGNITSHLRLLGPRSWRRFPAHFLVYFGLSPLLLVLLPSLPGRVLSDLLYKRVTVASLRFGSGLILRGVLVFCHARALASTVGSARRAGQCVPARRMPPIRYPRA